MKPYILHPEGRTHVAVSLLLFVLLLVGAYFFLPVWDWVAFAILGPLAVLQLALVLNFFRHPKREIAIREGFVLAPCDGKVVVIEEIDEREYFGDRRIQVSIFMSPLNVHVNRNPMSGVVKFFQYYPGKFLVAWHPKSSTENERTLTVVEHDGIAVGYKQIAGGVARRIRWYLKAGDNVQQGAEFGFIKFGSRMDLLLPLGTDILVNLGDKTRGGETVVAKL
jgi:phosphatidylserine decarboxylase